MTAAGQGLIPTLGGFAVVLAALLLATQVAFDLYARSAVTAVAVDAARAVARGMPPATSEQRARSELGAYAAVTTFEWVASGPREVVLRMSFDLRATRLRLVPLPGLNRFTRTIRVQVERLVCPTGRTCTTS